MSRKYRPSPDSVCARCAGGMRIVELGRGLQARRCKDCNFELWFRLIAPPRPRPASRDRHERHEVETTVYERQFEFSE